MTQLTNLEDAALVGLAPRGLRPEREGVDLLPREPVLHGQVLGGHAHRDVRQLVRQRRPHHVLQHRVGAELRPEPATWELFPHGIDFGKGASIIDVHKNFGYFDFLPSLWN